MDLLCLFNIIFIIALYALITKTIYLCHLFLTLTSLHCLLPTYNDGVPFTKLSKLKSVQIVAVYRQTFKIENPLSLGLICCKLCTLIHKVLVL